MFLRAWQTLLHYYDTEVGMAWKWQALDGVITKAPLGGEATGPSPVDRRKQGTKRSGLTDQRGAPLAVQISLASGKYRPLRKPLDRLLIRETQEGSNWLPSSKPTTAAEVLLIAAI